MQLVVLSSILLVLSVAGVNVGGNGTSEKDAMVHYLLGNVTTYPNLKLSLWNEKVYFNQTHLGKVRLHGELALRIQDWIDFDPINGTLVDNNIIEMGWCFRNSTTARYDGMKATFLYNLT